MGGINMSYPYGEPLEDLGTDPWDFREFFDRDSQDLLARMIYSEARNQSLAGMQGVAHVAKNRKASNEEDFNGQDTYEKVLLANRQFEGMTQESARKPVITGTSADKLAWDESLRIAKNMTTEPNPIGNRLYFGGSAAPGAYDIMTIGDHYFYNV